MNPVVVIIDCSLCFYCWGENEIEESSASPTGTDITSVDNGTDITSVDNGTESEGLSPAPSQVPKSKGTHLMKLEGQSSSHQSQAIFK